MAHFAEGWIPPPAPSPSCAHRTRATSGTGVRSVTPCAVGCRPWPERRPRTAARSAAPRNPSGRAGARPARRGAPSSRRSWPATADGRRRRLRRRAAADRRGRRGGVGAVGHPRRRARSRAPGRARARARSPCSAASRGSASPRCCSRRWPGWPRRASAASTSPPRSRPSRCGCAPSGSARCRRTCGSCPTPRSRTCSTTSTRSRPTSSPSTRSRRCSTPT